MRLIAVGENSSCFIRRLTTLKPFAGVRPLFDTFGHTNFLMYECLVVLRRNTCVEIINKLWLILERLFDSIISWIIQLLLGFRWKRLGSVHIFLERFRWWSLLNLVLMNQTIVKGFDLSNFVIWFRSLIRVRWMRPLMRLKGVDTVTMFCCHIQFYSLVKLL